MSTKPGQAQTLALRVGSASRLPDRDQDEFAAAIIEEMAADQRWDAALAASPDALERLGDDALAEHRAGRTKPLD